MYCYWCQFVRHFKIELMLLCYIVIFLNEIFIKRNIFASMCAQLIS